MYKNKSIHLKLFIKIDNFQFTSVIFSNPLVWFNNDGKLPKTENLNWPGTHIETNYKYINKIFTTIDLLFINF